MEPFLEVTGVQLSPSPGSTGSLLLASLPSSFSESFSDSAQLDSSSVPLDFQTSHCLDLERDLKNNRCWFLSVP